LPPGGEQELGLFDARTPLAAGGPPDGRGPIAVPTLWTRGHSATRCICVSCRRHLPWGCSVR